VNRKSTVIGLGAIGLGLGWIVFRGLSGNLVYFMTPTEVRSQASGVVGQQIRLGGRVVVGTSREVAGGVRFVVTDGTTRMTVIEQGPVPALFRSAIGVVAEGRYGADGVFHADTLLIKHSASYRPPAPGTTPTAAAVQGSS
jgi:cytochrome c-type biogenesis protein CcmE